ncbi:MAG: glutaredoxin family protein [Minisyncoccia bacterium]
MKKVIMYSTPTCHFCNLAKDFFDENKIKYEVYNVSADLEKRKEMIDRSGQMGVPVILIDDEVVVGFDEEKVREKMEI